MDGWQKLVGLKVKLVFDDIKTGSAKTGLLKDANIDFIELETEYGVECISISRIVRLEIFGGQDNGRAN